MSGGVDSAVAAARAVDAGHEVVGVHLALSRMPGTLRTGARGCCTIEDSMDAQRAANIIGIPVDRPAMRETTALGAAIAAGFAVDVWKEFDELKEINQKDRMVFEPNVTPEEGAKMFKKW